MNDKVADAKLRAILVDTPCEYCGGKDDVWTMIDPRFFDYPGENVGEVYPPKRVCVHCRRLEDS